MDTLISSILTAQHLLTLFEAFSANLYMLYKWCQIEEGHREEKKEWEAEG